MQPPKARYLEQRMPTIGYGLKLDCNDVFTGRLGLLLFLIFHVDGGVYL